MEGDLLRRGIGWYLKYEDALQRAQREENEDYDAPFLVNINPGTVIGFSIGAAYVVYPFDFIPDVIPVIGYVDDAVVLRFTTALGTFLWDLYD